MKKKTAGKIIAFIVLFLCLVMGSVGIVGGILCKKVFENSKLSDSFYQTSVFSDVMTNWSENVKNKFCAVYLPMDARQTPVIEKDTIAYETEEFDGVEKGIEKPKKETETTSVSYESIKITMPEVADSISSGDDTGSNYYYFYNMFADYIRQKTGTEKKFVHLTNVQFMKLLKTYSQPKSEVAHISDMYRQYDAFDEKDARIIDPKNDFAVLYSEKGNQYNLINKRNVDEYTFSFSFDNIYDSSDFYFPASLLDYSSKKSFEESLLTTPFSTVASSMAFIGMQEQIEKAAMTEMERSNFDNRTVDELAYSFEIVQDDQKELVSNSNMKPQNQFLKIMNYDIEHKCFDKEMQASIDSGKYNISETVALNLQQLSKLGAKSITIGIPKELGANSFGKWLVAYFVAKHISVILILSVLLLLFAICLFGGLVYFETSALYWIDRHYLLTKTIIAGGLVVIMLIAFDIYGDTVFSRYMGSQLSFFVIPAILLFLMYAVAMIYLFSVIRVCKAKQGKKYLMSVKFVKTMIVRPMKALYHAIKEIWITKQVSKRSLLLIMGYFFANAVAFIIQVLLFALMGIASGTWFVLWMAGNIYCFYRVFQDQKQMDEIITGLQKIVGGDLSYQIDVDHMKGNKKELASYVNHIGEGLEHAVAASIRDEKLKAELITNVSHDIKTPLTSIINYVDLIKREGIKTEPMKGYVDVLDQKSQRLKQLIEDLVEASKASTGNIEIVPVDLNITELLHQTVGEFEDKFNEKDLKLISQIEEEPVMIHADGRRCFRIIENLFQNIYKYAMPHTRVYLQVKVIEESTNFASKRVEICLKNISEMALNVDVEELMARFVRGDKARTTEGSGLGLSIAKSLTELQGGTCDLALDGDLFKVTLTFPVLNKEEITK